jgi:hypothetical protein
LYANPRDFRFCEADRHAVMSGGPVGEMIDGFPACVGNGDLHVGKISRPRVTSPEFQCGRVPVEVRDLTHWRIPE